MAISEMLKKNTTIHTLNLSGKKSEREKHEMMNDERNDAQGITFLIKEQRCYVRD